MKSAKYVYSVENVSDFEMRYYFSNSADEEQAKIYPHHVHDRLEFYVLLEGDVSFAVESTVYKLKAGDVVITKPNEMHNCILEKNSVHKHACFWFDSTSAFWFGDFLSRDFGKDNVISPDSKSKKRLLEIYKEIEELSNTQDKRRRYLLALEMLEILRKFLKEENTEKILPINLKNVLDYVDKNFNNIKNLTEITNKFYISQSTLNRMFKKHLKTTPKSYLETKRLAYSRRLLRQGVSVYNACMESGFSDYSNYIRLFKSRFNITPKQYQDE